MVIFNLIFTIPLQYPIPELLSCILTASDSTIIIKVSLTVAEHQRQQHNNIIIPQSNGLHFFLEYNLFGLSVYYQSHLYQHPAKAKIVTHTTRYQ